VTGTAEQSQAGLAGVVNLLKPPGPTSQQVVTLVRRLAGGVRAGHAGTLDPDAAGVLPVCLGRATRIAAYLTVRPKSYRALVCFGVATDTDDASGRPLRRGDPGQVTPERVVAALAAFRGDIRQVPPAYAAIKRGGRALYELARAGQEVPRQARPVHVADLRLVAWEAGPPPGAWLDVDCGTGFYVRALARDLGEALGCPAHLAALVRTRCGDLDLARAWTPEELRQAGIRAALLPMAAALAFLPAVQLDAAEAAAVRHGRAPAGLPQGRVRLLDPAGALLAVASAGRIEKVLA
jgi:tRNA pseudouridine55 synthase